MFLQLTDEEIPGGIGRHVDQGDRRVAGGAATVHAGLLGDEAQAARRPRHPVLAVLHDGEESERRGWKGKF